MFRTYTAILALLMASLSGCVTVINGAAGEGAGAAVGPPGATVPSVWQFLGVPQAAAKLKTGLAATRQSLGGKLNASGQFPGLEAAPPILPLLDPKNLESNVPAVANAAKLKAKQDQAAQTIKSIRYLAGIGCGCFDADGSVTNGLLAGLENCVEEVRYETVKAIAEISGDNCCTGCSGKSCCNEKLVRKLQEMAFEKDQYGCAKEPSSRVRRKAIIALRRCPLVRGFDEPKDPAAEPDEPNPTQPKPDEPEPPEGREYLPDQKEIESASIDLHRFTGRTRVIN